MSLIVTVSLTPGGRFTVAKLPDTPVRIGQDSPPDGTYGLTSVTLSVPPSVSSWLVTLSWSKSVPATAVPASSMPTTAN